MPLNLDDLDIRFRLSTPENDPVIREMLSSAGLPTADVNTGAQDFLLARTGLRVIGCVGLEVRGEAALLRSLAVVPEVRGRGLGGLLTERMLAHACLRGAGRVFLLTTTAEPFFRERGFERVERGSLPEALQALPELAVLCPSTAACMRKELEGESRHFPADLLRLRPDVPGASMWAVALKRAMLTYFEVAPKSRFESHRHEAEQITLVLEGELVFEVEGKVILVRSGEVIAIPSGVEHAVSTGALRARAVDAWSPVRREYLG